MRLAYASALVFAIVCLATGCSLIVARDRAPLAIRSDGENLVVAVCGTIEAVHLTMEERNLSEGRSWQIFWERDAFTVTPDQPLSTAEGGFPGAGDIVKDPPALSPGDNIRITITGPGPEGGVVAARAVFYVPDAGLTESGWQVESGKVVQDPCDL